jgi:hypothetical protein
VDPGKSKQVVVRREEVVRPQGYPCHRPRCLTFCLTLTNHQLLQLLQLQHGWTRTRLGLAKAMRQYRVTSRQLCSQLPRRSRLGTFHSTRPVLSGFSPLCVVAYWLAVFLVNLSILSTRQGTTILFILQASMPVVRHGLARSRVFGISRLTFTEVQMKARATMTNMHT